MKRLLTYQKQHGIIAPADKLKSNTGFIYKKNKKKFQAFTPCNKDSDFVSFAHNVLEKASKDDITFREKLESDVNNTINSSSNLHNKEDSIENNTIDHTNSDETALTRASSNTTKYIVPKRKKVTLLIKILRKTRIFSKSFWSSV